MALPGGLGTLDELVETLALAKLKQYHAEFFALNIDGFYDKFKELLDFCWNRHDGQIDAWTGQVSCYGGGTCFNVRIKWIIAA